MYIADIIKKICDRSVRISNVTYVPLDLVNHEMTKLALKCIRWDEDDFKCAAEVIAGEAWSDWYDPERFEEALHAMIEKHDCTIGITWDTVYHYLEDYCSKKYKPLK